MSYLSLFIKSYSKLFHTSLPSKTTMGRTCLSSSTIALLCLVVVTYAPVAAQVSVHTLPLRTDGRWIVNHNGDRVKLACANLASHLEPVVTEGLSNQPIGAIARSILSLGFNCVRLTWPTFLVTNDTLGNTTMRQSFQNLGLDGAVSGVVMHNPSLINLSLVEAFKAVVATLGENKLMVILDNHVSKPGWCCANDDGNGFFGDKYFDADEWVVGLTRVATIFKGNPWVVGMSLRNELRGSRQNVNDWRRHVQRGAEAVHSSNPAVLVVVSGLSFDTDLSFLLNRPLNVSYEGKTVFEMHWYSFTDGQVWVTGNPNQVCGQVVSRVMKASGFLLSQGWPLFVSEFGFDMRGTNVKDNRYLSCFMGLAAELDVDWALWTLTGSYYLRNGVAGFDETYGVLTRDWGGTRNSTFVKRVSALQPPFRGPGLGEVHLHQVIFHPATGLCVLRISVFEPLKLGSCSESDAWNYGIEHKTLTLVGSYFCLQADELGQPAKLGLICTESNSSWSFISDSKMHLAATLSSESTGCLDVDANRTIVVNSCSCLNSVNACDPTYQWFKLVNSTRSQITAKASTRVSTQFLSSKFGTAATTEFHGFL